MDFTFLTKAHNALSIIINDAKKEAEESKNLANNALAGTYCSPHLYIYVDRAKYSYQSWSPWLTLTLR